MDKIVIKKVDPSKRLDIRRRGNTTRKEKGDTRGTLSRSNSRRYDKEIRRVKEPEC